MYVFIRVCMWGKACYFNIRVLLNWLGVGRWLVGTGIVRLLSARRQYVWSCPHDLFCNHQLDTHTWVDIENYKYFCDG
jgi:hypothetical protein